MSSKKLIFVVDDASFFVEVVCTMLERGGYEAVGAYSGEECLQVLRSSERKPDCILLNWYMYPKDGWETLEEIRHDPELRLIPVIMESVHTPTKEQMEHYGRYFKQFLGKPFTHRELYEAIEKER